MCHVFVAYLGTLLKIFREINLFNSLWNAVISRNFCKTDESTIIIPTNGFLVLWPQQWENQIICLQFKFYVKLQSLLICKINTSWQSVWVVQCGNHQFYSNFKIFPWNQFTLIRKLVWRDFCTFWKSTIKCGHSQKISWNQLNIFCKNVDLTGKNLIFA